MISLQISLATFLYLLVAMLSVAGAWFYYDRRDRQLYDRNRYKTVFHCVKCGKIYTAVKGVEVQPCPTCRFENSRLKF